MRPEDNLDVDEHRKWLDNCFLESSDDDRCGKNHFMNRIEKSAPPAIRVAIRVGPPQPADPKKN
jgi:hypothetical protein